MPSVSPGAEGNRRIGDAAALVVERAGGDLCAASGSPGARDRRQREAVDLVFGGGQADHVEPVGHGPQHACRVLVQEASGKAASSPCGGEAVGKTRDTRRRASASQCRRHTGIDGRPVDRHRPRRCRIAACRAPRRRRTDRYRHWVVSAVKASTTGTPVESGIGDQPLGGGDAAVPVGRAGPAIVDDQRQRLPAGRQFFARVPDRLGQRRDDQRRHQQPQQRQPPRALMRRFLLLQHPGQDAQRRENFGLRLRRGQPQQPPDHRQRQQTPQDRRKRRRKAAASSCAHAGGHEAALGGHGQVHAHQRLGGQPVGVVDRVAPAEPLAPAGQVPRAGRNRHGGSRRAPSRRGRRSASRRSRDRGIRCARHRETPPRPGSATSIRCARTPWRASTSSHAMVSSGGSRKSLAMTMSEKRRILDRSGRAGRLGRMGELRGKPFGAVACGERIGQARPGDALAAARQQFGQRQDAAPARAIPWKRSRPSTCRAWRATDRPTARPYARPPIRDREHRCGRRGPSGASRCATSPRPRHRAGTARNSRRCRACGGRASRRSPC